LLAEHSSNVEQSTDATAVGCLHSGHVNDEPVVTIACEETDGVVKGRQLLAIRHVSRQPKHRGAAEPAGSQPKGVWHLSVRAGKTGHNKRLKARDRTDVESGDTARWRSAHERAMTALVIEVNGLNVAVATSQALPTHIDRVRSVYSWRSASIGSRAAARCAG
jgi:hypothetical protein